MATKLIGLTPNVLFLIFQSCSAASILHCMLYRHAVQCCTSMLYNLSCVLSLAKPQGCNFCHQTHATTHPIQCYSCGANISIHHLDEGVHGIKCKYTWCKCTRYTVIMKFSEFLLASLPNRCVPHVHKSLTHKSLTQLIFHMCVPHVHKFHMCVPHVHMSLTQLIIPRGDMQSNYLQGCHLLFLLTPRVLQGCDLLTRLFQHLLQGLGLHVQQERNKCTVKE